MTDWHVAACVRMSECVCGGMCECCQSHPRHTNVINKVKLLLLREQQKKEYTHIHTHVPVHTKANMHAQKYKSDKFLSCTGQRMTSVRLLQSINKTRAQKKRKDIERYLSPYILITQRLTLLYTITSRGKRGKHSSKALHYNWVTTA